MGSAAHPDCYINPTMETPMNTATPFVYEFHYTHCDCMKTTCDICLRECALSLSFRHLEKTLRPEHFQQVLSSLQKIIEGDFGVPVSAVQMRPLAENFTELHPEFWDVCFPISDEISAHIAGFFLQEAIEEQRM